jgi:hypothetical protein
MTKMAASYGYQVFTEDDPPARAVVVPASEGYETPHMEAS